MDPQSREPRRTAFRWRWLFDLLAVACVIAVACSFATRKLADWNGPAGSITNSVYLPALMMAHGYGFNNVDPADAPGVQAFLDFKTQAVAREAIPKHVTLRDLDPYQLFHRYLVFTVGVAWRCFGVRWDVVRVLCVLFFALYALLVYGLFRVAARPSISAAGTWLTLMAVAPLSTLSCLRDFSKGPFILAALLLSALLIRSPRGWRSYLGLAALLGACIGVGLGFRLDLLILLAPSIVVVLFAPLASMRRRIAQRAGALVLMLTVFVASSAPILMAYQRFGSEGSHFALMGLSTYSDTVLGLRPAHYERMYLLNDFFVSECAHAFARRAVGTIDAVEPGALPWYASNSAYWFAHAKMFPADMLLRAYAATIRAMQGLGDPPNAPNWLVFGVAGAAFAMLAARRARLAWLALFLALFYGGILALQFHHRHAYHLVFLKYWPAALLLDRLVRALCSLRAVRSADFRRFLRVCARAVLIPVLSIAALWGALAGLRAVQARNLAHFERQCSRLVLTPLPVRETPQDANVCIAPRYPLVARPAEASLREPPVHASYLMAEFDAGIRLDGFQICYDGDNPYANLSGPITLASPGEGPVKLFFPVYESAGLLGWTRFGGLLLPRDAAQHFRGLYRAEDADTLPLWPILAITPDAAKVQRFQTLLPVAPKSVTPVAPNAAPACYADTWVDSGNGQKTTEIWDRLLDVRPFLAIEAPEYLECLLCEDNVETALARFATRLYVLPDTVSIRQRTARGIALEAQRQLDAYPYASLVLARYAQELDGHYGVPVDTECAALERLDRWNEGTVAAKRALALDPEDAHALMHMDGCFAPPERRPLRVSYWREFVQKHPCAVNARRWLAQAFEETQNTDGAVRALTEAMRLAPGDVTLPDKLATLLLRYRRYEEAATVLRAALPRFPASPQLHQQLVRALCGAGRYDDARDAFRRCPLMPPDLEAALAECKARAFANAPGT